MKGIIQQIEERGNTYKSKMPTKKEFRDFIDTIEKARLEEAKKINNMEKEHTRHFIKRSKELGEPIPDWLLLLTSPRMNRVNGGAFLTGSKFYNEHKKWLSDE